jgi:hypothetical protein
MAVYLKSGTLNEGSTAFAASGNEILQDNYIAKTKH